MDAYILDAVRSPRAKARPDGGLARCLPHELVTALVDALKARGQSPREAEGLTLGCVGQVGDQGGHLGLVAKLHAGLDQEASALTLNNYCVSGLSAVGIAAQRVAAGSPLQLAGGVEMMSRVPFMGDRATYYADAQMPRGARYVPVVLAADRLAQAKGVTRAELDAVALVSQQRAAAASSRAGLSASLVEVAGCRADECVRPATTAESLAGMAPGFAALAKQYAEALGAPVEALHTLGHAPPVCDGAALALVGRPGVGRPRARIIAHADTGGDPEMSLLGGFTSMRRALAMSGMQLADMDRVEFMESFAVTMALFTRESGIDAERVNVGGGHIARGHPMGASGAILLSTLLDALDECEGRYGLVACTGAGGVGSAMVVERLG